jgi:midasin (ATPase involved in ribosome maturation)
MAAMSVGVGGKRILQPSLWRKVHVDPLPFAELKMVGRQLHPDLPHSVADAVLGVLRKLDKSGRNDDSSDDMEDLPNNQSERTNNHDNILGHGARHASVREYIKLLSRISAALDFEPGSEYATESQRLICLAETVDVFAMACPFVERRRDFIGQVAAPIWGLTTDAAIRYIENRIPSVSFGGHNNRNVEIGRARLVAMKAEDDGMGDDISTPGKRHNFAEINHALRLMESIAVCVSANEPALLVGETGEWLFILQELQLLSVYEI